MLKRTTLMLSGLALSTIYSLYGLKVTTVVATIMSIIVFSMLYIFKYSKREIISAYVKELFFFCSKEDIEGIKRLASEKKQTIKDLEDTRYYVSSYNNLGRY
jgi:hypothetical protein